MSRQLGNLTGELVKPQECWIDAIGAVAAFGLEIFQCGPIPLAHRVNSGLPYLDHQQNVPPRWDRSLIGPEGLCKRSTPGRGEAPGYSTR